MQKGPDRTPTAAKMFEPYLERAISFLQQGRQPGGIEGEVITPETAARLSSDYDLRVVFLMRSTATAAEVADPRGPNPWLESAPLDLVSSVATEVLSWSAYVQSACQRLGLPCFNVGEDFEGAMADAASALTGETRLT